MFVAALSIILPHGRVMIEAGPVVPVDFLLRLFVTCSHEPVSRCARFLKQKRNTTSFFISISSTFTVMHKRGRRMAGEVERNIKKNQAIDSKQSFMLFYHHHHYHRHHHHHCRLRRHHYHPTPPPPQNLHPHYAHPHPPPPAPPPHHHHQQQQQYHFRHHHQHHHHHHRRRRHYRHYRYHHLDIERSVYVKVVVRQGLIDYVMYKEVCSFCMLFGKRNRLMQWKI